VEKGWWGREGKGRGKETVCLDISFHARSRFERNCGCQPELVCQKCVRAIEDQVRPTSAQRRENWPTLSSPLLILSLRQSQTITAQKAAVSVAAGTAIGTRAFVCSFRLAQHRLDSFHPTTEIALIVAAGIFPAGLVFRAFILNTLMRFRVISADPIVSNGTARPRALWRLNPFHVCSRYHRGFEFGSVRDPFPSHLPCNHPAPWLSQKFFRVFCVFCCCVSLLRFTGSCIALFV
jgi:hypothetical protein